MMGCSLSDLNTPPPVSRPRARPKHSNALVLTELSDDEEGSLTQPTITQFHGRTAPRNGSILEGKTSEAEREVKRARLTKNRELRKLQEAKLTERVREDELKFKLAKDEEVRFRQEQERVQNAANLRKPLVDPETPTTHTRQTLDDNGNVIDDVISPSQVKPERKEKEKAVTFQPQQQTFSKFNLTGVTRSGWGIEHSLNHRVVDLPDPKPPTFRKKDIVPNVHEFNIFDKHAVKAPIAARRSISALVTYLKDGAENHFQLVRMFYRWITFNVSFDVEGFYGECQLQSTAAEDVLEAGLTIAEGYANLLFAMCSFEGIPCKVIYGVVKGYEYQVGDVINFTDSHLVHAWNAVYINRNWLFIDCTWGAGHVDRKRKWHRQFQEFYFIVDPDKMIVDHFPFMNDNLRASLPWQLLVSPISTNTFNQRLKMERAALEWEVKPVTHCQHHIITVRREVQVKLEEVGDVLEDYTVQFQRKDGSRNLERFYFACKLDNRTLKIIIRPPEEVDYLLQIFARKSLDATRNSDLLVTYILKCTEVFPTLRHFPANFRIYGAVPNYAKYGYCSDITKCCEYTCNTGEMIIPLRTKRDVKCMSKLEHLEESKDLTNYCLVTAKKCSISLKLRFPFIGYYKFTLFGKEHDEGSFKPVTTFLIDCLAESHVHSGFPLAFDAALDLKCVLYRPLWKDLPANSTINIVLGSPNLVKASVMYKELTRDKENHVFEGTITTPPAGQPFTIYGQTSENSPLVGLFHFNIF